MSEDASQRLASGAAWNEFCDRLKAAGELVLEHAPDDDFDRAEGLTELGPGLYAVSATMLQGLHVALDFRGAWTEEREERLAVARTQLAREARAGAAKFSGGKKRNETALQSTQSPY